MIGSVNFSGVECSYPIFYVSYELAEVCELYHSITSLYVFHEYTEVQNIGFRKRSLKGIEIVTYVFSKLACFRKQFFYHLNFQLHLMKSTAHDSNESLIAFGY